MVSAWDEPGVGPGEREGNRWNKRLWGEKKNWQHFISSDYRGKGERKQTTQDFKEQAIDDTVN